MGIVVEFGVPAIRVRRNRVGGYCEVTIFPDRRAESRGADGLRAAGKPRPGRPTGKSPAERKSRA